MPALLLMGWEDWREFYLELMKAWQWTPQEVAAIPVPQLVSLWMKDAAEGWETVTGAEAIGAGRARLLARLAKEDGRESVTVEEAREILNRRKEVKENAISGEVVC